MTKNKSKTQRGTTVKKPEEKEIPFLLFCVNDSVDDSNRESKYAIEHLRTILEYPDLTSSDAEAVRQVISKFESGINTLVAVKVQLGATELSKIPYHDDLDDLDLPPGVGARHPDDPGDETIIGRVKGPWAVHAWVNYHHSAVQVDVYGYREARKGVDVGDRSITLASDDDWRPLVAEAANEMRRRTGLPVSPGILFGVMPHMDFESDDGADDSEREDIEEELSNILEELEDAGT